jgi:hypothetical protein
MIEQKAILVRSKLFNGRLVYWSVDLDSRAADRSPGELIAEGWRVSHASPVIDGDDSAHLMVFERPESTSSEPVRDDLPLSCWNERSDWMRLQTPTLPRPNWDGSSIPLHRFGLNFAY